MKGLFIIIEGCDGTGKTTQADRLCKMIRDSGRTVLHLREPGSTRLGEEIRTILLQASGEKKLEISPCAEVFLYMASRAQLFSDKIVPALDRGCCVVLERSYYSTYAYQGFGLGLNGDMILDMGKWANQGAKPDRVVLLDMDHTESIRRLTGDKDRIESRDSAYHQRVREGYLDLAGRSPELFRIVDSKGSPDEVHARVLEAIHDVL